MELSHLLVNTGIKNSKMIVVEKSTFKILHLDLG